MTNPENNSKKQPQGGSFQPEKPAAESFNLYIKDANSDLISLINRENDLTESDILLLQRESITLSELVQRQECGDTVALTFVSSFEAAMKLQRGPLRDQAMRRLQDEADKSFGRGVYAPDTLSPLDENAKKIEAWSGTQSDSRTDDHLASLNLRDFQSINPSQRLQILMSDIVEQSLTDAQGKIYLQTEFGKVINLEEYVKVMPVDAGSAASLALRELQNGGICDFLIRPDAPEHILFSTLLKTLDAIERQPESAGKALTILGRQIELAKLESNS